MAGYTSVRGKYVPSGPAPTLGQTLDAGDRITVHCEARGCGHQAPLDVAALVAQLGRGLDLGQLRARLRCTACGAKGRVVTIVAPAATAFGYGYPRTT